MLCMVFLFFKQKTAYDMRISDWSSDVCSSDLECGRLLHKLSTRGLSYITKEGKAGSGSVQLRIGGTVLTEHTDTALDAELTRAGYDLGKVIPSNGNIAIIILAILGLSALSGATYGPAAALLSDLFPPRIR